MAAGVSTTWRERSPSTRPRRDSRALTLWEVVIVLGLLAVGIWFLLPRPDPALQHGRRLACIHKLHELHKGALAYRDASNGFLPLAWHVAGPSIADDLSNLTYSRFALYELCDPTFRHLVTPQEIERSVGLLPARQQKYRLTAAFWKCPASGWTDDYFAPGIIFRQSAPPAREAELVQALPAAERPLFADVNASFPNPNADHFQDPGHNHELHNGFSLVKDSGMDIFLGVGQSLRVDGQLPTSHFDPRHGGAANILFLDGHADSIEPSDEARLRKIHDAWNHLGSKPAEK